MSKSSCIVIFALLCFFASVMLACKRSANNTISEKQQTEFNKKRYVAASHLEHMLNTRDFERALLYIDSLHREYPNDPQFAFAEAVGV